MNLFVADPGWGWWIILYFYLGGIAAGAYFVATLVDLIAGAKHGDLARIGYWIAFPLVCLCGIFLILDLDRPDRFWHMLFKSEIVHQARAEGWPLSGGWQTFLGAFAFKHWSPMSVGAWALALFGACSFLSLLGSLWPHGFLARALRHGVLARVLQIIGCTVGFFIAAYTGALLTATNQPMWSDDTWIASLFLASAASTGLATMILLVHWRGGISEDSVARLEKADVCALLLELVALVAFFVALGPLQKLVLHTVNGKIFLIGTLGLGLVPPILLHLRLGKMVKHGAVTAALFALVGGFLLRYGILRTPPEILRLPPDTVARLVDESQLAGHPATALLAKFSPEDQRSRGGGRGADPGNRPADLQPPSKVFHEP